MSTSLQHQKHSRHTYRLPAGSFGAVSRIHCTSRLFASIPVKYTGWWNLAEPAVHTGLSREILWLSWQKDYCFLWTLLYE